MNHFRQHIPNFCSGIDPVEYDFSDITELHNKHPFNIHMETKDFDKFVVSDNYIMAVFEGGFRWWVVGSVTSMEGIDYPEWDGGRWLVKMPDGSEEIIESDRFASSCGEVVTLKDGTATINLRYL